MHTLLVLGLLLVVLLMAMQQVSIGHLAIMALVIVLFGVPMTISTWFVKKAGTTGLIAGAVKSANPTNNGEDTKPRFKERVKSKACQLWEKRFDSHVGETSIWANKIRRACRLYERSE